MSEDAGRSGLAPDERRALESVLDELIPPSRDGRLPGAGELGLVAHVEAVMAQQPDLVTAVAQGLAALAELVGDRGPQGFPDLPRPQKLEILNELATLQPAFLPGLVFHTYVGYYQSPRVLQALGMEGRPPAPLGYAMEPTDPSLLDAVRGRPKLYREV